MRTGPTEDNRVERNAVVHQDGLRLLMEEAFRVPIKEQIDPADMDAEMIRLGDNDIIRQAARNILVSVAGDEDGRLRKFRGQRHHLVGEIVAPGSLLQSHVSGEDDGIGAHRPGAPNCAPRRLDRILEFHPGDEPGRKPERHSGSR